MTPDIGDATRDIADATRDIGDVTRDIGDVTRDIADVMRDIANVTPAIYSPCGQNLQKQAGFCEFTPETGVTCKKCCPHAARQGESGLKTPCDGPPDPARTGAGRVQRLPSSLHMAAQRGVRLNRPPNPGLIN